MANRARGTRQTERRRQDQTDQNSKKAPNFSALIRKRTYANAKEPLAGQPRGQVKIRVGIVLKPVQHHNGSMRRVSIPVHDGAQALAPMLLVWNQKRDLPRPWKHAAIFGIFRKNQRLLTSSLLSRSSLYCERHYTSSACNRRKKHRIVAQGALEITPNP